MYDIPVSNVLGDLEEQILLCLRSSQGIGTVTEIRQHLSRAHVVVSGGAVDQTLRRMNQKGWVGSDPEPMRRGAGQVRYWQLTVQGGETLDRAETIRQAIRNV